MTRMSTSQYDASEPIAGIWSAEMGGYVTSRRIASEMDTLDEE